MAAFECEAVTKPAVMTTCLGRDELSGESGSLTADQSSMNADWQPPTFGSGQSCESAAVLRHLFETRLQSSSVTD